VGATLSPENVAPTGHDSVHVPHPRGLMPATARASSRSASAAGRVRGRPVARDEQAGGGHAVKQGVTERARAAFRGSGSHARVRSRSRRSAAPRIGRFVL
jgi:hypothetical protein